MSKLTSGWHRRIVGACVSGAAVCGLAAPAQAAFVFYNGDPTGISAATGILGSDVGIAFDDFTVPAGQTWTLPGFYANLSAPASLLTDSNGGPAPVEVEIRTGLASGNAGTLAFATTLYPTYTAFPRPAGNTSTNAAYHLDAVIPAGAPISAPVLTAGTYWLGIAPFLSNTSELSTGIFETNGTNAVNGVPDHTSFFYDSSANLVAPLNSDLSYGLEGVSVPEPAAACLLMVATMSLLSRRPEGASRR